MNGGIAPTDYEWYQFLLAQGPLDEVNFWRPSAHHSYKAEVDSPYFFKLKAAHKHAICGFGYFKRYVRLPDWLAWESFETRNGCRDLEAMRQRIAHYRQGLKDQVNADEIGCILIAQPTFFQKDLWVKGPFDWPANNLGSKKYDLTRGEGLRVFRDCVSRQTAAQTPLGTEQRYGLPHLVHPRLGQGIFRIAVMEAYRRACAVTSEHSLPALEASHIRSFARDGPNEVRNGLLLRADLHRLFDQGYVTITTDLRLEVSPCLKRDYQNGKSYYPLHGKKVLTPHSTSEAPASEFLIWHNANVYRAA